MVPIGRYFIFKTLDYFNHSGTSLENLFLPSLSQSDMDTVHHSSSPLQVFTNSDTIKNDLTLTRF